jgi:uncharacterized membrane protein
MSRVCLNAEAPVDCFYHHAVPSIAACTGCGRSICATCRSEFGDCPSCRLAARLDAASGAAREITGGIGPSRGARGPSSPPPRPAPARAAAVLDEVRPESRALVALGYPFWPLAALALLDRSRSPFVRRQAYQALGFNLGIYGLWLGLTAIASIPIIGWSAWPLVPLVVPVALVASVVYGFKVWQGEDVRVPFIGDYVDRKSPV